MFVYAYTHAHTHTNMQGFEHGVEARGPKGQKRAPLRTLKHQQTGRGPGTLGRAVFWDMHRGTSVSEGPFNNSIKNTLHL